MNVQVKIDWLDEPALELHHEPDAIAVTAHAGLSIGQVRAACAELDEHGPAVFQAWQAALNAQ
jgi:hypothetical protein